MDLVAEINKVCGEGSAIRLQDEPIDFDPLSTSCPLLDEALGGGIKKGGITEIFGSEGSGKTTLALHLMAQSKNPWFIDAEHALNPAYAKKIGVDIDKLPITQPQTAEQALDVCAMLVREGSYDTIVLDSVAALVPSAEVEGEMAGAEMGMRARLMSKALRIIPPLAAKNHVAVIFINQVRSKIGGWGSPETTPGGRALPFAATHRIKLAPGKKNPNGMKVQVQIVKNKVAPPFKECHLDLVYGEGFSTTLNEIEEMIKKGSVIEESGWYKYKGKRYRLEKLRQLLKEK